MALSSQIRKLQVRLENIGKCRNSWGGIYKYITLIAIATQQTFFHGKSKSSKYEEHSCESI